MSIRLLRCLVTVVDEGHFGRAAERLYISAPALSQHIRKLESQLRITLLDRDTHPIRPTEAAAEFVDAARAVLAEADRAAAVALTAKRRSTGTFRIGFTMTFAGPLTRPILDGFGDAVPEVTVDLVELGFGDQTAAVVAADVDASFAVGPIAEDPRIRADVVLREPRALCVSEQNPLSERDSISICELGDQPQIPIDPGTVGLAWSRWWSADPRPDGSRPRYGPFCHTVVDFLEFIAANRGVGITAQSYSTQFPRPGIRYVPIRDIEHSTTYLCTRADDRSPLVGRLREVVAAVRGG